MMAQWTDVRAVLVRKRRRAGDRRVDPIFGRPITFYLFTLPVWQLLAGWLTTLAVIVCAAAIFFAVVSGGARLLTRRRRRPDAGRCAACRSRSRPCCWRLRRSVYLGRFERLLTDHTIFAGVTYTDAHVAIPGMLLRGGRARCSGPRMLARQRRRRAQACDGSSRRSLPAVVVYMGVGVVGWYVNGFVVKPNELVREAPYIAHNIEMTRRGVRA